MDENNMPDVYVTLFLAHAIACKKLAELSNKTPMQIACELSADAQFMIQSNSVPPQQLVEFMESIMPGLINE